MADQKILDIIDAASDKYGLDRKYLRALAKIESNYNPSAKNSIGASGLFQFIPPTAKQYGLANPFDPVANSDAAARMFKENLAKFNNPVLAAAAHNMGPGNVNRFGSNTARYPRETQNYVQKFQALTGVPLAGGSSTPTAQNFTPAQNNQNPLLSQQSENLASQIDPSQFQLPEQAAPNNTFLKALGGISTIGGNIANIISAIKGNPGTGNPAIESGLGILGGIEKQKREAEKVSQLNALLANPALPKDLRVAIGLSSQGVPPELIRTTLAKPDNIEQALKLNELVTKSPEYQEKLKTQEFDRAKALKDYESQLRINEKGVKSAEAKALPPAQIEKISENQSALKILADLREELSTTNFKSGPASGLFGGYNPFDKSAQKLQASINLTKQVIGKFLEGGVLRKEDEEKYEKILPTIKDLPEVQAQKLAKINNLLSDRYKSYLSTFKKAGYDTDQFQQEFDGLFKVSQTNASNVGRSTESQENARYLELLKKR